VEDFAEEDIKYEQELNENIEKLQKETKIDNDIHQGTIKQDFMQHEEAAEKQSSKSGVADTQFYLSEEEFNDERMLHRLEEANQQLDQVQTTGPTEIEAARRL
jgi:hypothetical protein